jgi:hypothetical protein
LWRLDVRVYREDEGEVRRQAAVYEAPEALSKPLLHLLLVETLELLRRH